MPGKTDLEQELAELIVHAVNLSVPIQALDAEVPLFRDGWGLDSIDMLEISVALSKRYGVQIRSDDQDTEKVFATLRSLTTYVAEHRVR